ncbi:carbon-nitrogen hydrolase family protein [Pseudooceanicola atlanticus]|uniref:Amidohydrolase n=1 Tax=Pseudooceanicola atlanticus TaxID=1461694 RepID=A0A0A0EGU2_9RHOB|nr:carbon-nitrogen hydrolase family protein [Pseudooceanicola atlanticus]KGM49313.1 amidohydrolase [Pseudooceanicola atlanticus]
MKIAAATYPLDWFANWEGYEAKMTEWVAEAAGAGADLLLFPEYGAMELASLGGIAPDDLGAATGAVVELLPRANDILSGLAQAHGVHILAPSGPAMDGDRLVNRAAFLSPTGGRALQDKQMMTPWEVTPWQVQGNGPVHVFDTALGKIGVLICYDSEFPLLGRMLVEQDVRLILVPSCTETVAGYHRVRIGSMARALEGQCFTAMSSTTGAYPIEAVEQNHGAGGIFCPPDKGLPETGIVAVGALDRPGWTYADLDMTLLDNVRHAGGVRTLADWPAQTAARIETVTLA